MKNNLSFSIRELYRENSKDSHEYFIEYQLEKNKDRILFRGTFAEIINYFEDCKK